MQVLRIFRGRRRAMAVALAGLVSLGLVACGSTDDTTDSGSAVTIKHVHGETVIQGTPAKIVTLGNQWLDAAQALGVTPVGYIDTVATVAGAPPPWEPKSLETAKTLNLGGDIPEQVAALAPDLILADPAIATAPTYAQLSKIAPTLPGLTDEASAPWQDQVTTLGKVLGKQAEAEQVVTDVRSKIDSIAQANPGLRGKTFVSTYLAGPTQLMVLTDPEDGSGRAFTQLGMSIPENLRKMPSTQGRVALAPERADELSADLLLAGYAGPGGDQQYRELPGFAGLPAVRKNAVAFLGNADIGAINQPTALSLPYILDKLAPTLANATK
ncbi:ABC transporter substrate-binding protein [Nocardia thraciensis]